MSKCDKKLAGIRATYGVVAEEQRETILTAAEEEKKSLTAYLIEQKLSTEAGIIGAVAKDMDLPPIDIDKVEIKARALEAGMLTLRGSGISQAIRGVINMQEALSSSAPDR